jgi:Transcriptional regulator, AbiEi antitoxin/Protein of unknown function (DUF559)
MLLLPKEAERLVRHQSGIITRAQAMAAGMTRHGIYARLDSGRWQRLHAGVYSVYSGPVAHGSQLWAAVLGARPGAVLSHQTAAELYGLLEPRKGGTIHVMVAHGHTVAPLKGVVVHYSRRVAAARHPALQPPRTRLEETVLDLAETERTTNGAIAWLLDTCASRRTTPERLLEAMDARLRMRRRKTLLAALGDAEIGVQSILEHGHLHRVERPHGLPEGTRQRRTRSGGATRYEDVRYEEYGVVVELDGQQAHPEGERWRDSRRDNDSATKGLVTLRYTYADVMERPCEVADEIARTLRRRGYTGVAHRCGDSCAPGEPTVLASPPEADPVSEAAC